MKRGIVRLIMVLAVVSSTLAFASDDPINIIQTDDSWSMSGPQHGAYVGVRTEDVTKERMAALNLKEETGVEVTLVDREAPAGKAGIKEHDVILSFNGQKVDSEEMLRRVVRETPPGRTVTIGISRAGQLMNVPVTLADRKQVMKVYHNEMGEMPEMPEMPPMPPMPPMDFEIPQINVVVQSANRTGIVAESLSPQLAQFFGASGVLVRSVEKGSLAETAGVKAGDVIVRVDKEKIADMGDWRRSMRGHVGAVPVTVLREKHEQTLTLKIPERKRSELKSESFDFDFDMDGLNTYLESLQPIFDKEQAYIATINSKQMKDFQKKMEKMSKDIEKSVEKIQIMSDED